MIFNDLACNCPAWDRDVRQKYGIEFRKPVGCSAPAMPLSNVLTQALWVICNVACCPFCAGEDQEHRVLPKAFLETSR
jgi:hypothetical protein